MQVRGTGSKALQKSSLIYNSTMHRGDLYYRVKPFWLIHAANLPKVDRTYARGEDPILTVLQ